jgi:hypothetical protein
VFGGVDDEAVAWRAKDALCGINRHPIAKDAVGKYGIGHFDERRHPAPHRRQEEQSGHFWYGIPHDSQSRRDSIEK